MLGLGIAAAAVWAAAQGGFWRPAADGPPPLDDIDDASRVRLEQVLRDAEQTAERGR